MLNNPKWKYLIICIAVLYIIVSFIIHMPVSTQRQLFGTIIMDEPVYSDFVALYNSLYMSSNTSTYIAPYIDTGFNYPFIAGFYWGTLTWMTYIISGNMTSSTALTTFYIMFSFSSSLFYITVVFLMTSLATGEYAFSGKRFIIPSILFPSFIVYLNYDYTIVGVLFLTLGIYLWVRKRFLISSLFLSLLLMIIPIPASAMLIGITYCLLIGRREERAKHFLSGLLISLLIMLVVLILLPYSGTSLSSYLASMNCKNCLYLLFFRDLDSQYLKAAWLGLIYGITSILLLVDLKNHGDPDTILLDRSLLIFSSTLIFGIVFIPQYMLYILVAFPLFFARLLDEKAFRLLWIVLMSDVLNVLIILLWFKDYEIRSTLSFLGIPLRYSPWTLDSPIQWIAQTRNILLVISLLVVYWSTLRLGDTRDKY